MAQSLQGLEGMEALVTGFVFVGSLGTAWVIQRAALGALLRLMTRESDPAR